LDRVGADVAAHLELRRLLFAGVQQPEDVSNLVREDALEIEVRGRRARDPELEGLEVEIHV
jgi:hypothetical protein